MQFATAKWHLLDFYELETLTVEACLWDQGGRRRGELLSLEALLCPDVALDRTARALEKQASWKQGYCPWDISNAPLRRWLLVSIGIDALVAKLRAGWCWCKYDLKPYADQARALAHQIKVALHFTIKDSMSDTQVIHQLLSQLGLKFTMHWSRAVAGSVGEKLRTYVLDQEHWSQMNAVLERREAKRQWLQERGSEGVVSGSSVSFEVVKVGGDPAAIVATGLTPASLPLQKPRSTPKPGQSETAGGNSPETSTLGRVRPALAPVWRRSGVTSGSTVLQG